jgi:hypothetical protein
MATTELWYAGSLTLGGLTVVLDADEGLSGKVTGLKALAGRTVATMDDSDFPAAGTLKLLPTIGGAAPPSPTGFAQIFVGEAVILHVKVSVAAYRAT